MILAVPREKLNGETSIRPYRTGTRSGSRVAFCASNNPTGSGRSVAGAHLAWLAGGVRLRASLPLARRSSTLTCGTLVLATICPSSRFRQRS